MKDNITLVCPVEIRIDREDGTVEYINDENMVVALGKAHIVSRLKDNTATVVSHIGVGTGATAPAHIA